jgi:hypothetical protein
MEAMEDMDLLREYATRNSQAAFEALVARRIGFVYSAAVRQVRDPYRCKSSSPSTSLKANPPANRARKTANA